LDVLSVKDIEEKYQAENGEITALKNISFSVKKGEFISIVGASGCGNAPPAKRQLSSE
jgi:ABC-type dipeptide/oligopeptide/nickel transport system, ATPase component